MSGHLCAVGTHVRMSWPLKPLKIRLQRAAISPRGVQQCVSPVHCCTNTHTQSPMCLSHIPLYSTLSLSPPCIFVSTSFALYSRIYLRLNLLPPGTRPRGLQPKHWRVYSPTSQGPQLHHESDIRRQRSPFTSRLTLQSSATGFKSSAALKPNRHAVVLGTKAAG